MSTPPPPLSPADRRKARQAQALRDNLRRRKAKERDEAKEPNVEKQAEPDPAA